MDADASPAVATTVGTPGLVGTGGASFRILMLPASATVMLPEESMARPSGPPRLVAVAAPAAGWPCLSIIPAMIDRVPSIVTFATTWAS